MNFGRTAKIFFLALCTAMSLAACGGGGGDSAPPLQAPTVTTSSSNTPGIDNAIINGSVNPNGQATTAWFEYGQDSSLSSFTKTVDQSIAAGASAVSINQTISNLGANTTYYYRVAAQNPAGTSKGTIVNVKTLAPAPTTITNVADTVTINSANLRGDVNPNGLATTAWFEYGQDSSLSSFTKTADQSIAAGTSAVSITQAISGLSAATPYYFRVAASSAGGAPKGVIKTFTTSVIPPPIANAGTDQEVIERGAAGPVTVTLNGSGSSDGGNGGTITYSWAQVAGPGVTLSSTTVANPTFPAPDVSYPGQVLSFRLTVNSSRGSTATDNVDVNVKWGYSDNFSTNTTSFYTTAAVPNLNLGTFTYNGAGKVDVGAIDNNGLIFSHSVPASNKGVFFVTFNPTIIVLNPPDITHGGIWIRLMQDSNNYYEISNFDWGGTTPELPDVAGVRKIVSGSMVQEATFTTGYNQGSTYSIKITYSSTQIVMEAFGQTVTLPLSGTTFTVNSFSIATGQQNASYDDIKLEAGPP